jgi:hypothetical protein
MPVPDPRNGGRTDAAFYRRQDQGNCQPLISLGRSSTGARRPRCGPRLRQVGADPITQETLEAAVPGAPALGFQHTSDCLSGALPIKKARRLPLIVADPNAAR